MTKKVMKLGMLVIALSIIVGCSHSTEKYNEAIDQGKVSVSKKEFNQALEYFNQALKVKKADSIAKAYQKQMNNYLDGIQNQKDKEYAEALLKFELVIKEQLGLEQLVSYAEVEKNKTLQLKAKQEAKETGQSERLLNKENGLWNENKKIELANFMEGWGQSLNQSYQRYDDQESVDFYGTLFPLSILNGEWQMTIEGASVEIEWSPTGEGDLPYQLVSVYSDADTQADLKKHLYFFMLVEGEPKVYITQQNQGNLNNYLDFKETDNQELKTNFSQIIRNNQNNEVMTNIVIHNFNEASQLIFDHYPEELELTLVDFDGQNYAMETVNSHEETLRFLVNIDGTVLYSEGKTHGDGEYVPFPMD